MFHIGGRGQEQRWWYKNLTPISRQQLQVQVESRFSKDTKPIKMHVAFSFELTRQPWIRDFWFGFSM